MLDWLQLEMNTWFQKKNNNNNHKKDYDAEILHIKSKHFTAVDYKKFATEKNDLKIK